MNIFKLSHYQKWPVLAAQLYRCWTSCNRKRKTPTDVGVLRFT
ncbi:MAG: hypothetical protein ACI9NT_002568, partial [Bacteroidia bacterium]